jgi:hypothetical protein
MEHVFEGPWKMSRPANRGPRHAFGAWWGGERGKTTLP